MVNKSLADGTAEIRGEEGGRRVDERFIGEGDRGGILAPPCVFRVYAEPTLPVSKPFKLSCLVLPLTGLEADVLRESALLCEGDPARSIATRAREGGLETAPMLGAGDLDGEGGRETKGGADGVDVWVFRETGSSSEDSTGVTTSGP